MQKYYGYGYILHMYVLRLWESKSQTLASSFTAWYLP